MPTLTEHQNAAIAKATALKNALNTAIDSGLWNPDNPVNIGGDEIPQRNHYSVHSQFARVLKFNPDTNGVEKAEVDEEAINKKIQKSWS